MRVIRDRPEGKLPTALWFKKLPRVGMTVKAFVAILFGFLAGFLLFMK